MEDGDRNHYTSLCVNTGEQKFGEGCSSKRQSNAHFQIENVEYVYVERVAQASDTLEKSSILRMLIKPLHLEMVYAFIFLFFSVYLCQKIL